MYNLTALEDSLAGTIYAGKLHFSPKTGSTSIDAMAAGRSGAPHGSVYFADEQIAGRGRGGHTWHSTAGQGLYVNVLLRPQFPPARLALLPLAAGLASVAAIRDVAAIEADLRWPNDVLIGARKVVGILAEAQMDAGAIGFATLGIGINVHQRSFDAEMSTPATSLDLECGRAVSRQDLLVALLESLERETRGLQESTAGETIRQRLEQASSWLRGRRVEVHGPQACTGITEGLDENGFLLVRTAEKLVTVQTGGIRAAEIE